MKKRATLSLIIFVQTTLQNDTVVLTFSSQLPNTSFLFLFKFLTNINKENP